MGDLSEHFDRREFFCHCKDSGCGCKDRDPDPALVRILEAIRAALGGPLVVRSGWRCATHNARVGGAGNSAHLRGCAVDLAVGDNATRYTVIRVALAEGVARLGIGPTVVHLDVDPTLPRRRCWIYGG